MPKDTLSQRPSENTEREGSMKLSKEEKMIYNYIQRLDYGLLKQHLSNLASKADIYQGSCGETGTTN